MKKLHTYGWYAARISPHLPKNVFKPVPSRLIGGFIHLIVALAGILAIGMLDLNLWLNLILSVVIGSSFASMGFLGHEILHGTVVRTPWLRNFLGGIAFIPLTTGPRLWRKWHNIEHHIHTQNEEKDPDAWPSMKKFENNPLLRLVYKLPFSIRAFFSFLSLAVTFTAHSLKMFKTYIKDFNPKKQPIVWVQLMVPWTIWIGLLVWMGPINWIFAYVIPALLANFIVMAYIATNHRLNPLVPVNDPLANSLTVTVPKWVDVLHFNFSYHTEHHLFPGMSPKYYPLVKEHIKKMWPDRYHEMSMMKAMVALWKTPRLYYEGNDLIDPYQQNLYGSLGHGLDPDDISYQKMSTNKKSVKPNTKLEKVENE